MQLITSSEQLRDEFSRLTNQYDKFYWNVAWAGIGSTEFNELKRHRGKISKIIVGIHFYQTHPSFIETFINDNRVKYIMQPNGTYHPKLYLFYTSDKDWELLVGSSNFTFAAFNNNTEANILISPADIDSDNVLSSAKNLINSNWQLSKIFTQAELANYAIVAKNLRPKLAALSGFRPFSSNSKPFHEIEIININWDEYYRRILNDRFLETRLEALRTFKKLFSSEEHFKNIDVEDRKLIAGLPNKSRHNNFDVGIFGSMRGRGTFANKIIINDYNISKALDQIPNDGQVTERHYKNFIKYFKKTFPGNYIGTSSRLLAMKRPDVFYCLTSKNQIDFCRAFGIRRSDITYESYWGIIIEPIAS